jgi:hypothetical protein
MTPDMPSWWTKEKPFMIADEGEIITYAEYDDADQAAGEVGTQVWTADPATGDEVRAKAQ